MLAKILNNIPCCPICDNQPLGNLTGEYRLVSKDGIKYTEFERFCNGGCHGKYKYHCLITLDSNTRYSFDKVEVIKESKGDTNVNDSED